MWAALFPGQGSQVVGMGKFLVDNFAIAREAFEEAGDALSIDFKKLCFEDPDKLLNLTEYTQPALLLVSTATFQVVQDTTGIEVGAAAGHSVGEYAAIVTAGGVAFADALRAVRARGQAMQKAVPIGVGGMTAVMGLSDAQVETLCAWGEKQSGHSPIEPANFNSPGQVVISGSQKALDWLRENAKSDIFLNDENTVAPRMKLIPLSVSAPFHCRLMKPAEETMEKVLAAIQFRETSWPIVQNIDAHEYSAPEKLRENLVRQVSGAVRWTQCMMRLRELGTRQMIEFGTGKVLSGLSKKIDSAFAAPLNVNTLDDLRALEAAARSGGRSSERSAGANR